MRDMTISWDQKWDAWAEVPCDRTVTLSSIRGKWRLRLHDTGSYGLFALGQRSTVNIDNMQLVTDRMLGAKPNVPLAVIEDEHLYEQRLEHIRNKVQQKHFRKRITTV